MTTLYAAKNITTSIMMSGSRFELPINILDKIPGLVGVTLFFKTRKDAENWAEDDNLITEKYETEQPIEDES